MNVKVNGQHIEITPALRDYVQNRFERIEHHLDDVMKMEVTLEVVKTLNKARGNVHVRGEMLHAEAENTSDMYAAIDALADKLHHQALKHKEKNHKHE